MFVNNRRASLGLSLRRRHGILAALSLWLATAAGAWADPAKIEFLPPPMDGTISLGIYDSAGKLVRVLHREADMSELTTGVDGLITNWDGKDDKGKECAPGTYRARGVMVGELEVEGVDFVGNDWVTGDDAPHVRGVNQLGMSGSGAPVIAALPPLREDKLSGSYLIKYYSITLKPASAPGEDPEPQLVPALGLPKATVTVYDGKLQGVELSGVKRATAAASGSNGTVWIIDGSAIKQYSKEGKLLRTVAPESGDPPPANLTASPSEEKVYVLFKNAKLQRLRGYDFTGVKQGDEPKELFENDILACDTYEQIASELKFPDEKPFVPSQTLTIPLVPNPLLHKKPSMLEIKVTVDENGCYLATTDGLPLTHVSDTKYLAWAVMGQPSGSKAFTVFDSDGAVVEQFQVSKPGNMMTFDAGPVQWPAPAVAAPTPAPTVTPAATPAPTSTPAPRADKESPASTATPSPAVSSPTPTPAVLSGS